MAIVRLKERDDKLIKDYLEGKSLVEIITTYKISPPRIYYILKRAGIKTRNQPNQN